MPKRSPSKRRRQFWQLVALGKRDECWPWKGSRQGSGRPWEARYGKTVWNGVQMNAQRVAYLLTRGPLLPGQVVRHTCNNPPCCNFWHLIAGTQKQNVEDRDQAGRGYDRHGAKHPRAIITLIMAQEILMDPDWQRVIAKKYGVTQGVISKIKRYEHWTTSHLKEEPVHASA